MITSKEITNEINYLAAERITVSNMIKFCKADPVTETAYLETVNMRIQEMLLQFEAEHGYKFNSI